jgi:hypothetical protein
MSDLIHLLKKKNLNGKAIFSVYKISDWYDGAISGIAKSMIDNEYWFFDIVASDFKTQERIFLLLKIDDEWLNGYRKLNQKPVFFRRQIKKIYDNYRQKSFLMKADSIDSEIYDLVELKNDMIVYFSTFNAVMRQSKKNMLAWFEYFSRVDNADKP